DQERQVVCQARQIAQRRQPGEKSLFKDQLEPRARPGQEHEVRLPLSVFSARKPSVWLPVQASTVKVMSAETSRPARQTLRVAWRTRAACPGMSNSRFNASSGPWNTSATAKSTARPAR